MSPEKMPLTHDNSVSLPLNHQLVIQQEKSSDPYELVLPSITGGKVPPIDIDAELLSNANQILSDNHRDHRVSNQVP